MSTRSTIFWDTGDSHVYEETSEANYKWGRFQGNTVYAEISQLDLVGFSFTGERFKVRFNAGSALVRVMGVSEWDISAGDVVEVDYDADGLLIKIEGGSQFAKRLTQKDFTSKWVK